MNEHEIDRIAASIHHLRPDWPIKQLKTLLGSEGLKDRPRRDVCVALAWVACETGTANPYRVLEAGPWWKAAAVEGATVVTARKFDRAHCCSVCSLPRDACRNRWTGDHEYEPAAAAMARKGEIDVHRTVAALKANVTPVAPPPLEPTFAALTHDRPELAARLEQLADRNPGLRANENLEETA